MNALEVASPLILRVDESRDLAQLGDVNVEQLLCVDSFPLFDALSIFYAFIAARCTGMGCDRTPARANTTQHKSRQEGRKCVQTFKPGRWTLITTSVPSCIRARCTCEVGRVQWLCAEICVEDPASQPTSHDDGQQTACALHTWPRLAAASGRSSNAENSRSVGAPSSASMMARALATGNAGTRSCVRNNILVLAFK